MFSNLDCHHRADHVRVFFPIGTGHLCRRRRRRREAAAAIAVVAVALATARPHGRRRWARWQTSTRTDGPRNPCSGSAKIPPTGWSSWSSGYVLYTAMIQHIHIHKHVRSSLNRTCTSKSYLHTVSNYYTCRKLLRVSSVHYTWVSICTAVLFIFFFLVLVNASSVDILVKQLKNWLQYPWHSLYVLNDFALVICCWLAWWRHNLRCFTQIGSFILFDRLFFFLYMIWLLLRISTEACMPMARPYIYVPFTFVLGLLWRKNSSQILNNKN